MSGLLDWWKAEAERREAINVAKYNKRRQMTRQLLGDIEQAAREAEAAWRLESVLRSL